MNKKIIALISILVCVAILVGGGTLAYFKLYRTAAKETVALSEFSSASDITLTAHRGLSALAPENTIPAIELAGEKGYKYVEFDIQLTKDGIWVLNHDEHLVRMSRKLGYVKDYTYFELAEFPVVNGANYKDYPGLKLPTLDDALDACLKYNIMPMIEIKDYDDEGIKSLVESIVNHGCENACYVISFRTGALKAVEEINPDIKLLYVISELDDEHIAHCEENPDWGVSFKADPEINTPDRIKLLQDMEKEIFTWTVDEKDAIDFYYPLGVKNFVTNRILP